jgi:putative addiction module CopG family antidote
MNIRLRPEIEKLIEEDIQRGPYQSVDEFVERAVSMLHEQEMWLAEHRTEIGAKIEEGYAAAQRGELIDSDSVRRLMDERKTSWRSEHRKA